MQICIQSAAWCGTGLATIQRDAHYSVSATRAGAPGVVPDMGHLLALLASQLDYSLRWHAPGCTVSVCIASVGSESLGSK